MNAKRAIGVVGVMIAAVLMLTGCFKLNMAVKVNNEKSVDYDVVYAVQKSVLGDKSFDEFMESYGSAGNELEIPEGAAVVDYEDGKYKGKRITAVNLDPASLASASSSESPFELKREGDFYIVTMGGIDGAGGSDPAAAGMAKSIFDEATVRLTFPGKIVEAKGATIEGNTATFDLLAVTESAVQVKAETGQGFGIPMWLLWSLIGVLVVAAVLVLLILLLRRKSAGQAAEVTGMPYPPHGYQAGQPPQGWQAQPGNVQQPYQPPTQPRWQPPQQPDHPPRGPFN